MNKYILIAIVCLAAMHCTKVNGQVVKQQLPIMQTQTTPQTTFPVRRRKTEIGASQYNKVTTPNTNLALAPINQSVVTAVMNNSNKTVTYPDGSAAHYSIVRKGDNEKTDDPKITMGKKDNSAQGGVKTLTDNGQRVCQTITKNYTVTTMNQDMLSPSALDNISLGSVYNLVDLRDGQYKPVLENRSPVWLQMSEKSTDPISVTNPIPTILNQQVALLRSQPFAAQPQGNGQYLASSLVTSSSDFDLAIGASYSGWGVSLADKFGYKKGSNSTKFLLDYTNPVYTIIGAPQTGKLFNAGDPKNDDPSLVYVDKITYGVRLMVYFECNEDMSTITNTFTGSGWGASLNVDASLKERSKNIQFKVYLYGNRSELQATYKGIDELLNGTDALIKKIVNTTPYVPMVLGQPISYSLRFVSDNAIAATTCSVLNSPDPVCSLNPDRPQDFRVWIAGAKQSAYAAVGWSDMEVFDRNNNSLGVFTMVDGTIDLTKAKEMSASGGGNWENEISNQGFDNAANKGGIIKNISKEDREGGKVRIWLWFKNGDYGFHCRDAVQNGQEKNSPIPSHNNRDMNYVDIPLRDFIKIDAENTPWHKKVLSFFTDQTTPGQLALSFAGDFR
jgi:hypothetical protein